MSAVLSALRQRLGDAAVLAPDEIAQRATSYWDARPMRGAALARPTTTEEVCEILRHCHAGNIPVVTLGGLTNCVEGTVADEDTVLLSMERLNRIEQIDPIGGTATVQAGVVLQTLQEAVAAHGLQFPVDLGPRGSCTIGGNVATNAGGINVIRHGMARNWVLGLEAVLADGTLLSSMNRMLKNNAGYDLKQLFIGTEGTLGVVTRVVLRLCPAPKTRNTAMIALASFEAVIDTLKTVQQGLGGDLSAYEVMWGSHYRAVTAAGGHRPPLPRDHAFYVVLEAEGVDSEQDSARFEALLAEAMERQWIDDAVIPRSEAERTELWQVREDFSAVYAVNPVYLYDVSLPIVDMAAYVSLVSARVQSRWPEGFVHVFGHIGDGNLHLLVHPGTEGDNSHRLADEEVYRALQPFAGSISAEHGIGLERLDYLSYSRSETEIQLMRQLKRSLDSRNILNRGKVLEPGTV